ncbi:MAG: amidohydrolase [Acidobacteriota bacterium]
MSKYTRGEFIGLGAAWAAALGVGCRPGSPGDGGTTPENEGPGPDLALLHGRVYTVDEAQPRAQALAVKNGRFLAVGSDDDIQDLITSRTEVIDAAGMTVTPGFIDAHCHPASAGVAELTNVNADLRSIAEIKEAMRRKAAETPPGYWVSGFKYDDTKLAEGRPLSREDLDEVVPDHPAVVGHRGGHTGVYNSKAFELAGITASTPDPTGGKFFRENGELTGKVAERARGAFRGIGKRDPVTRETRRAGIKRISELMTAAGLTSVHDAGVSTASAIGYQDAHAAGEMRFRVYMLARGGIFDGLKAAGISTSFGNEWLRVGAVKFAADGSASERTMRMSTPYVGRPNDYGILTMSQEQIHEVVEDAHRHGFQVGIHANGDVAIDMVLNAYERVQKLWPRPDPRHRIEHCSLVNPDLLARIKALGAIPTPFYTYVHYHGNKWVEYGQAKMRWMFAHRSFLDAGIPVAGASDYVPGPFEPLMAIQSLVTRKDFEGRVWGPNQRISVDEALRVCTLNGAHASFEEKIKGSIRAGKLADFVLLADDPHDVDPDRIKQIEVVRTVVGDRTMHPMQA